MKKFLGILISAIIGVVGVHVLLAGVITGLVGVGIVHLIVEVGLMVGVYVLIKKHVHALLSKLL